jgi:crossover junction endodeoxyribonuclease RusA
MIKIVLEFPPSVNRLWRTTGTGGMYRSPKYASWRKIAMMEAKIQAKGKQILEPYKLTLEVVRPDKRKRDLDNLLKAVSDCLVSVGIIDDSKCEHIEARWVHNEHPCTVTIERMENETSALLGSTGTALVQSVPGS